LRVGVTAAKTLAYAVGAEVFAVNTLHVIARQAPAGLPRLCAVLDAQRQQLFAADFRREGDRLVEAAETRIEDIAKWLAGLSPGTAVTGPGLATLRDKLPTGTIVVDAACWTPRAATVALAAYLEHRSGRRHDLWTLNPVYYRTAEEKRLRGGCHDRRVPKGSSVTVPRRVVAVRAELVHAGRTVLVEAGAGLGSGISDREYLQQGAQLVSGPEEIFARAELVIKVKEPQPAEWLLIRSGQVWFTYFHFAASRELTEAMLASGASCVAYETLRDERAAAIDADERWPAG
jgi:hypothetical protein